MAAKQIQCPNCGAPVDATSLENSKCPYCGNLLIQQNPNTESDRELEIERMTTFSFSEQEAKEQLAWQLAQKETVPLDLFRQLDIIAEKVYLPAWDIEVDYRISWNCLKVITTRDTTHKELHKQFHKDYYPVQGVVNGDFTTIVQGSDKYDDPIPNHLGYCTIPFDANKIDKNAQFYKLDISKSFAIDKNSIGRIIAKKGELELDRQLPESYTDAHFDPSYTVRKCQCVLCAVWKMSYTYKGKAYCCWMHGNDCYHLEHPKDGKNEESKTFSHEVEDPIQMSKFGWTCTAVFVLPIILAFFSFLYTPIFGRDGNGKLLEVAISLVLMGVAAYLGLKMSSRQDEENRMVGKLEEMVEELQESFDNEHRKRQLQQRMRSLSDANIVLLKPFEKEITDIIEGNDVEGEQDYKNSSELSVNDFYQKADEYNSQVIRDNKLLKLYYVVLIVIALVTFFIWK